jgi:hypothetical protein
MGVGDRRSMADPTCGDEGHGLTPLKRILARALAVVGVRIEATIRGLRSRMRAARSAELDQKFHTAYDVRRSEEAQAAPLLVLAGDALVLLHGSKRLDFTASDPVTRIIQAAAHAPVGIFAVLHEHPASAPLEPLARARLSGLSAACEHALDALAELEPQAREDVRSVLERSQQFIVAQLQRDRAEIGALSTFAREIGPLLLTLTSHATTLELNALDRAVEDALSSLSQAEIADLEAIVTGAHQARASSLGMQYFQKRFGEPAGEERRVAYAESAQDVEAARTLAGTRRLDRSIARAFFGDAKRLQRDVLSDAAKTALDHSELKRIG